MERVINSEETEIQEFETEIQEFEFHSGIEINLDGTDEEDLYYTMVERIIENIAALQAKSSQWKYRIVLFEWNYTL